MSSPMIPFHRPDYGPEEESAVVEVLRSGATGGGGPVGERVEAQLAERFGTRHALLVSSCTHAIEAALSVLGVGPGDEVIVPGFTYVSAVTAVERQGALPVFVDIEDERFGLDPDLVEHAITPRTRVILPVHYAGRASAPERILEIAERRGLAVVEDAAQAVGSTDAAGRALGSLGQIGCVSFHESKNISCGEGGALFTNDDAMARALESFRDKGTNRAACMRGEIPHYSWVSPGSSLSLSEIQAAVLEAQLAKLDRANAARAERAQRYLGGLAPLEQAGALRLPAPILAGEVFNWHLFAVLLDGRFERDAIARRLRADGVSSAAHFQPLDGSQRFRELCPDARPRLPVTHDVSARLLRLPIHPALREDEQERVMEALRRALEGAP